MFRLSIVQSRKEATPALSPTDWREYPQMIGTQIPLRRACGHDDGIMTPLYHLRRPNNIVLFRSLTLVQEMTFNVDGISLLEKGETPDGALAKELGERGSTFSISQRYFSPWVG